MREIPADERYLDPVLDMALRTCTDHLDRSELIEVFRGRSGEEELNDLLRHALNRLLRDRHWVAEREVTDKNARLARVDLAVTDISLGWANPTRVAWIEAKLQYPANAFVSPQMFTGPARSSAADQRKLAASPTSTAKYLLTWVPDLARSVRPIRYVRGHKRQGDMWISKDDYADWRNKGSRLLESLGSTRRLTIREETSTEGDLTLEAWVTRLPTGTAAG